MSKTLCRFVDVSLPLCGSTMKEFLKRVLQDIEDEQQQNPSAHSPEEFQKSHLSVKKFLITLAVLWGFFAFLYTQFSYLLPSETDKSDLVYFAFMSLFVSWWTASESVSMKHFAKQACLWGGMGLLLMVLYSYRFELVEVKDRVMGNLRPEYGMDVGDNSVSFPVTDNGHFYIVAQVNGQPVRFLVDTGASSIVLTPEVAGRLGYDLKRVSFSQSFETANGQVRGAPVLLNSLQIRGFYVTDIPASINQAPMQYSLLGMEFFRRLKSYKVEREVLTLTW